MSGRDGLKLFWPIWTIYAIVGFLFSLAAPASFYSILVWLINVLFCAFTMLTVWRKL